VDGALLVDCWDELVLPRELRQAWQPVVDGARGLVDRLADDEFPASSGDVGAVRAWFVDWRRELIDG
jgi:hypothetical protein